MLCVQIVIVVLCSLGARCLVALEQVEVTQYQRHGEHALAAVTNRSGASIGLILWIAIYLLHILHVLQVGTQKVGQVAGIGLGTILHEVRNVGSGEQRRGVEGHLTVGQHELHIGPCADRHYLRIFLNHILFVHTRPEHGVTVGDVCIATVDYMIVIAHLQVDVLTILIVLFRTVLAKVHDGGDGVAQVACATYQVGTTFTENHIAFGNVLERLQNTPVGIEGIGCHLV